MGLFTFFTSSWFGLGDGGGLVAKSCSTLVAAWTIACQDHLSMGFARQEYWSGLPFSPPGDLPDPGIKPRSPTLQVDSLPTQPLVLLTITKLDDESKLCRQLFSITDFQSALSL